MVQGLLNLFFLFWSSCWLSWIWINFNQESIFSIPRSHFKSDPHGSGSGFDASFILYFSSFYFSIYLRFSLFFNLYFSAHPGTPSAQRTTGSKEKTGSFERRVWRPVLYLALQPPVQSSANPPQLSSHKVTSQKQCCAAGSGHNRHFWPDLDQ